MQLYVPSGRFALNTAMRAISILLILTFTITSNVYAQQSGCKCCTDEFRQFDFWVGSWIVYDSANAPLGTNVIDIIQDSCVLRENWKSARSPYTGTSYNFYNPATGSWTQSWVDNQGGSLLLRGGLVGSAMQMSSEPVEDNQGRMVVNRITWAPRPDGTVRQHWESSVDNGPWSTLFDGIYKRSTPD